MVKDDSITGRFEVTYFTKIDDIQSRRNGALLYSKKDTGKLPFKPKKDYQVLLNII